MSPPPLLGYNNNVRHRGQVFHIQTEDSGVNSPRIMTHLFADGGRIVKSTRTDYAEHLGRSDLAEVVKRLMKEQHKAMFVELRSGALDARIGFEDEAPQTTLSDGAQVAKAADEVAQTSARAPPGTFPSGGPASEEAPAAGESVAAKKDQSASEEAPAAAKSSTRSPGERPYAAPRPASIFSATSPVGGIFGEVGGIDEKSLDDAILSYLAEDPSQTGSEGSGSK